MELTSRQRITSTRSWQTRSLACCRSCRRTRKFPTLELIREIVDAPSSTVLIARDARDRGRIVGMLTLVVFRIPTGVRAWIEDVVVDAAVRGRGVGEALSVAALTRATAAGARTVDLTSRPSREAADALSAAGVRAARGGRTCTGMRNSSAAKERRHDE